MGAGWLLAAASVGFGWVVSVGGTSQNHDPQLAQTSWMGVPLPGSARGGGTETSKNPGAKFSEAETQVLRTLASGPPAQGS